MNRRNPTPKELMRVGFIALFVVGIVACDLIPESPIILVSRSAKSVS